MVQALTFSSNFKLGHYVKIPPQSMFWAQIVVTVITEPLQSHAEGWLHLSINRGTGILRLIFFFLNG
ncbi:hypothetical protein EDD18DRAFT_1184443 [Armillaria luteobubalina]|uniref:Uncharacterized protein n=1 Tax=Armillaria luteobubalina TaxID=153913 RepID=A0AA39PXK8_9AGAR|nr:hypothetical protein EDD18DRAFT_1184443 [Armillaria luteobubalina]